MVAPRSRIGRVVAGTATTLVVGAGLEAALVASCRHQWQVVLSPRPARVDEVVGAVLALAAVLVGAWLGVTTLAALLGHLPGRLGRRLEEWSRCWSPALARRVATVLVGASVGGVLAPGSAAGSPSPVPPPGFSATAQVERATAPRSASGSPSPVPPPGFSATAPADGAVAPGYGPVAASRLPGARPSSPGFEPTAPSRPEPVGEAPAPGWVPARPVVRPQPAPALVAGPGRRAAGEVVVLRGDSLWSIVARHLGPDATDAEVARAWPRWWEANRSVVGDDPDLILPGQVLTVPRFEAVTR